MSPALAGGFLTTVPPGESVKWKIFLKVDTLKLLEMKNKIPEIKISLDRINKIRHRRIKV